MNYSGHEVNIACTHRSRIGNFELYIREDPQYKIIKLRIKKKNNERDCTFPYFKVILAHPDKRSTINTTLTSCWCAEKDGKNKNSLIPSLRSGSVGMAFNNLLWFICHLYQKQIKYERHDSGTRALTSAHDHVLRANGSKPLSMSWMEPRYYLPMLKQKAGHEGGNCFSDLPLLRPTNSRLSLQLPLWLFIWNY